MPLLSKPPSSVIIIGGGFSGLAMACQLQRTFDLDDYIIYDRNNGIGGTWWANTYPGCGVDIPGICYSLSFAPNPNFTKLFPPQSEILNYMHRVASYYGVCDHFIGNTEWEGADWQDEKQLWLVRLKDLQTGDQFTRECRILISGVGGLVNPRKLDVEGSETFEGSIIHTAQWQKSVDLRDKHVSVIGNGGVSPYSCDRVGKYSDRSAASAIQLVPEIIKEAKSVTQFMRSSHHLVESPNYEISPFWQSVFCYHPSILYVLRFLMFIYMEVSFLHSQTNNPGRLARANSERNSREYRRVFDRAYTKSLHRDNFTLTNDPIVQIKPTAIVTDSKEEIYADIIILATGFALTQYDIEIKGRHGKTRAQYWKEAEGKSTFKTVAMSEFPNFFYILGPNSGRVYTSTLVIIESQVNLVINVIRPIILRHASSVEVRASGDKQYQDGLNHALENTIYNRSCSSYFIDEYTGKNWFIYPWNSVHLWWEMYWNAAVGWEYHT
ncbi:FAD/NAD(P)-binding domain-containing protein [Penicillium cf. griseofulvum]|uniref:FAD/NAD(P)-binding domain-containing protein n=1 Tax=Penicillium cf. griseofulvum TaxID=2972120 RepID=A0A9W9JPX0_9EURO|nr:FAD/NAD(P)-binding domain-containing protein [Penicillium cf. griseofulvum]KAJ5442570.1 FAD/NAD(P)-binding domain-containing protein [Penicillium cf. griseofulvum]